MSRSARFVSGVVAVIFMVRCGPGPSKAELRRALAAQISSAWEIDSLDVEGSEDVGAPGAPLVNARFDAKLRARENTYATQRMEGDVALIKPVLAKGERRSLFGTATSAKGDNGWQTKFSFASNAYPPEGKARSELAKRTVVIGTEEERQYRLELERERQRQAELARRTVLSLIEAHRVLECEQITAAKKVFPCRFEFTSLDVNTGNITASNRWFSLKTGALKPQNHVSGKLDGNALLLTEQIKGSELGKNFLMHYTLRLSKAQTELVGEFAAPGGKGTMRLKL
ncbi:MAG TPA: hypothetical protein VF787_01885 [Thermoanaerobaculia bacterium]